MNFTGKNFGRTLAISIFLLSTTAVQAVPLVATSGDTNIVLNAPLVDTPFQVQLGTNQAGSLLIEDGGVLNSFAGLIGLNGTGVATVTGSGSQWNNDSGMNIGFSQRGTLEILNEGLVTSTAFSLAANQGSDGSLLRISGTGSLFDGTIDPNFDAGVGRSASGRIEISDGGTLRLNGLALAETSDSTADVSIDGVGSSLINIKTSLQVGRDGQATLDITDGGNATARTVQLGRLQTGEGTSNVDGIGSTLVLSGGSATNQGSFLTVGGEGEGTLNVTNSGQVLIGADGAAGRFTGFSIGRDGSGVGVVNIEGVGSSIVISGAGDGFGQVGRNSGSDGTLNITDGGQMLNQAGGVNFIGRFEGAQGTVNVDGAGSLYDGGAFIGVGVQLDQVTSGGTGILNVTGGGTVTADVIKVGANGILKGAGGIINADVEAFDGGTIAPGSSPGTLIINGNLIIDTGVLQLETENGVADELIVNGIVQIGENAIIELFFDVLSDVVLEDFFDINDPNDPNAVVEFLPGFDFDNIAVFTSDAGAVGGSVNVSFGGQNLDLTAVFGVSNAVPEPGTLALFGIGLVGLGYMRRRRKAA